MQPIRAIPAFVLFVAIAALPAFGTTGSTTSARKPSTHSAQTQSTPAHHASSAHAGAAHSTQAHTTQTHGTQAHGTPAHGAAAKGPHKKGASKSRRPRGQQAIESSRVIEIQQALIRVHYYSGEANGNWDDRTKAAMMKFQADQGWQTKLLPDARALKKLGLGPDYSNAINAKNSNFADPPPISSIPPTVSAGFADAAGVKQ